MTRCRDIDGKKCKNTPTHKDFFKIRALLGALTSCNKLEKTNGRSLGYLKMERGGTKRLTKHQKWLVKTPLDKPGVYNDTKKSNNWTNRKGYCKWSRSLKVETLRDTRQFSHFLVFNKNIISM